MLFLRLLLVELSLWSVDAVIIGIDGACCFGAMLEEMRVKVLWAIARLKHGQRFKFAIFTGRNYSESFVLFCSVLIVK